MKTEFEKYATGHLKVPSLDLYNYKNSMTPYILEEREMRATQMDIFSRLMMDRILWCAGEVNVDNCPSSINVLKLSGKKGHNYPYRQSGWFGEVWP